MASAKPQSNVKCYTAEEIGEAVGLSGGELKEQVRSVSENILKQTKVQFSDDYQPRVYNIWTQQKIAEHSGVSRQYVHKVLSTDKSESDSLVDAPPTLQSRTDKADFRKLPVELQQQVAAKEVSLNAAAIAAAYEKAKAKERYDDRPVGGRGNKVSGSVSTDFEPTKSRDAIGARVGVSGRTHEKFEQAKKRTTHSTKNCGTDTEDLIKVIRQEVERQRRVKQAETQTKKENPITQKIVEQVPRSQKEAAQNTAELFNTNRTYVKTAHEDLA